MNHHSRHSGPPRQVRPQQLLSIRVSTATPSEPSARPAPPLPGACPSGHAGIIRYRAQLLWKILPPPTGTIFHNDSAARERPAQNGHFGYDGPMIEPHRWPVTLGCRGTEADP